jgi:hypothetical protein
MNKKTLLSIVSATLVVTPLIAGAQASLPQIVQNLAKNLQLLGGALAVIGFMVAGIMYISATANPKNMEVGKQALVAAIIGIIILILAPSATAFVSNLFFN